MASTIENIDNYLKKNKKPLYANLNKWFGEKKSNGAFVLSDDAKNLKSLWEDAQRAKGINNKIKAFNDLKAELAHWTDNERLAQLEEHLEQNNMDNYEVPEAKLEVDQYRFFNQLTNYPDVDKLTDLSIDNAYTGNYDYEQMKALAYQYGYDYTDKEDRKEFLSKLSDYEQAKAVDAAFGISPDASIMDNVASVITDFGTPITKEYAKRNYQTIQDPSSEDSWALTNAAKRIFNSDLSKPLAGDAITNLAMMGTGTAGLKPVARGVVSNVSAPVIREGFNMALNDKSFKDATIDAGGNIATNIATPYAMKRAFRWSDRMLEGEVKQGARDIMNQTADKIRDINQQIKNGKVFRKTDVNGNTEFYTIDYKGRLKQISNEEAAKAKGELSNADYDYFQKYRNIARTTPKKIRNDDWEENMLAIGGKEKFEYNKQNGLPRFEGMNPYEIADAANIKPRESRVHSVANGPGMRMLREYATNFQGESRYATPMVNAIASTFGPIKNAAEKLTEKDQKFTDTEKAELKMYKRLRELHAKHDDLFAAPKIPEKYKKYIDEADWLSVKDIF